MKIIVPMAGSGKRFFDKGYDIPKPLIKVDGKPIIEHVANLFPGEEDFIFICSNNDMEKTDMANVLKAIKSKCKIIGIEPHKKGPVFSVKHAFSDIKDDDQVIVSYCDFNLDWNYSEFKKKINKTKCDGAIPCYIGFHPHLLHKNLYAGVLADKNNYMIDIREKHCFAKNPMRCRQSCGIYYFKSGYQLKRYFQELIDLDINLNHEHYISMVFYLYKRDKLKVYIQEIKQFAQWGTPEDLEEYEAWSEYFAKISGRKKGATTEPSGRNPDYAIKLNKESEEYKKSYNYWKRYFLNNPNHPYGK